MLDKISAENRKTVCRKLAVQGLTNNRYKINLPSTAHFALNVFLLTTQVSQIAVHCIDRHFLPKHKTIETKKSWHCCDKNIKKMNIFVKNRSRARTHTHARMHTYLYIDCCCGTIITVCYAQGA